MNKYSKFFISLLILLSLSFSQVSEKMVEFKFGEHNALTITLNDVDKDVVQDVWKDVNKPLGKADKKKGEYITTEVKLEGLSNPIDWYVKFDKSKGDIELALCAISKDEFISSSNQPENFAVISKFITDFAYKVEKTKVRTKLEKEKKELEKLQKDLKKATGNIKDNNDDIDKHTKRINKSNKEIDTNLKKQNDLNSQIAAQGLVVEGLLVDGAVPAEESNEFETFEKENDSLQKLKKKLEKVSDDYDDLLKTIEKSTKKIEKAQKDNKSESKKVDKLKKKISKQGELVESIRRQLEAM